MPLVRTLLPLLPEVVGVYSVAEPETRGKAGAARATQTIDFDVTR